MKITVYCIIFELISCLINEMYWNYVCIVLPIPIVYFFWNIPVGKSAICLAFAYK